MSRTQTPVRVLLVVLLIGAAGCGQPGETADEPTATENATENEAGAHPQNPPNGTTAPGDGGANGSAGGPAVDAATTDGGPPDETAVPAA